MSDNLGIDALVALLGAGSKPVSMKKVQEIRHRALNRKVLDAAVKRADALWWTKQVHEGTAVHTQGELEL